MTDQELLKQFEFINAGMAQMENRIMDNMDKRLAQVVEDMDIKIRESETRTKVFIENTVTGQIKALFDGYQAALENQAVLKIANETLAKELDDIKTRLTVLESKTA